MLPQDNPLNAVSLADLPIKLLQRLDLARPMLNHDDDRLRPACTGMLGGQFDRINHSIQRAIPKEAKWAAVMVCKSCPIRDECSDWADEHKEEGLWGGIYRRRTHINRRDLYERFDLLASLAEPVPA